jgi:hypothetical protein
MWIGGLEHRFEHSFDVIAAALHLALQIALAPNS